MNFTISGPITGSGAITKVGLGAMLLSGSNAFSGGVNANAGTVIVGSPTALGAGVGVVTMAGGTIQDDGLASRTVTNNVILGAGTNTINTLSPSSPFTFTGIIAGTGSLTKGYASLTTYENTMNAAQTISFGTGITGGNFTLTLNGAPTGNISVSAGAITAASETGNTATITAANNFAPGDIVYISGVGVSGYNGVFTVATASATQFTYVNPTTGLGASSGGSAFDATLTAANVQTALNALPATIVGVYKPVVIGAGATISVTFQNIAVGANVAAVPTLAFNASNLAGGTITSITPTIGTGTLVLAGPEVYTGTTTVNHGGVTLSGAGQLLGTSGTNAQQTLTFGGTITGGTFTLTLNGQTTAPIPYVGVLAAVATTGLAEAGNTVTVTMGANPFTVGQTVTIAGVAPAQWNGTFTVLSTTATTFTVFNPIGGIGRRHHAGAPSAALRLSPPRSRRLSKRCPTSASPTASRTSRCRMPPTRSSRSRTLSPAQTSRCSPPPRA